MAQQINLYSPVLLAPRRLFSALAIVQSLALLVLGLAGFAGWTAWSTAQLKHDLAATVGANDAEKARLTMALAQRPAPPKDTVALEQQLAKARAALAERRTALEALDGRHGGAGTGHAGLLHLLADTVPASVWLSEVRRGEGRLEIAGATLQPEALQPWLARLAAQPELSGQRLRAVKVEHSDEKLPGGADSWTFRVVSAPVAGDAP